MILFVPEYVWVPIIKFHEFCLANVQVIGAWWKYFKRLLLTHKSWMLFIISLDLLIRMPEAYATNETDRVSLMKGQKPISIPESEIITTADTEDYIEEDSEEEYDDTKNSNASGEFSLGVIRNT